MQISAALESVSRKTGDEEVKAEVLDVTKFSLENFSPPISSNRPLFKSQLIGDRDLSDTEKVDSYGCTPNDFSEGKTDNEEQTPKPRAPKKFRTRISYLKSKFFLENHRLVEQIESPSIFILYSENKREIFSLMFWNTIIPHIFSILVFLTFHFIMDSVKLSCFMPEKSCPCSSDEGLKKFIFSFKELLVQGNFFIFPYYLIFCVLSLKYSNYQKFLYFCVIPSTFALIYLADGSKQYPFITKGLLLGSTFLAHMLFNFLRIFKNRRTKAWNYFKLTIVLGTMSVGAYYFTNFQLRIIKEFAFRFRFGDLWFTVLIWIMTRLNNFLISLIVQGYEKLMESEKLNYNPLLYFIKFFLTVQYGFRLANIGQLKTMSLAFGFSLVSLFFSLLRFHFGFSPLCWIIRKVSKRKNHCMNRKANVSDKQVSFVMKFTSLQRLEIIIVYGSRLIYLYFSKRLFSRHSMETTQIIDCSNNLNSEPNYMNLFTFLIFDLIFSILITVYVKVKKLNHLKYIVDSHNVLFKGIIFLALGVHLEFYIFHLVSIDPQK